MILKKVEGRRNPRAWHGSRLTVSGLHGHPSTPNPRPKRRVETPGDPWGVPQPPGPSSPAYGTPPTANRWFLPLSSSQWGQTLPTTSVMFPVRIEPRGHAQGGKKIPGNTTFLSIFNSSVHAAKIAVCSHKMLRYLFPLNTFNVNRDNVNKNVENKSIREIQIPNAEMVKSTT